MKKSLFLLPLLAGLALCGCGEKKGGGQGGGGGSDPKKVTPFTITVDSVPGMKEIAAGSTYSASSMEFTAGGVSWATYDNNVGRPAQQYHDDEGPTKLFQFRKEIGGFGNSEKLEGVSEIEINWVATFASEDTVYFPVVKAGASAEELDVVAPEEKAKLTGVEETAYKWGKSTDKDSKTGEVVGQKTVYKYTTHYKTSGENAFFAIMASTGGATYVASVSIK